MSKTKQEKPKPKYSMPEIVRYVLTRAWAMDKAMFGYVAIYTVFQSIYPFAAIIAPKLLIDELLGLKRLPHLIMVLIGFFVISAGFRWLIEFTQARYMGKATCVRLRFIWELFQKNMTMPFVLTEDPTTMDKHATASRAINSNDIGVEGVMRDVFGVLSKAIAFFGYIAIMIWLHPLVLLVLMANVLIAYYFTIKAKDYEFSKKDDVSSNDRKSKYIYDTMYWFQYGKDIRIYGMKEFLASRFRAFRKDRVNMQADIQQRYLRASIVDGLLMIPREGVVYAYLIYKVLVQGMTLGDFTMYFATITAFSGWMRDIMNSLAHLREESQYIGNYREYIEMEQDAPPESPLPVPQAETYSLVFENVSFKYPHSDKWIFKNLTLEIPVGQRLAIVGNNGAGKTTLVKLMTRLHDPTEGRVLLNGIDIRRFDRAEYSRTISAVFQEIKLFAMTVAENVALSETSTIDRQQVADALDMAGLTGKIASLPHGLDTSLLKSLDDEGVELSGGENQRLALARALYKNAPLMILDEPTAALDPLAEYNLYKRFDDMIGHKTAIYISHRLASTRFCDCIAFFEDGKILEYGTHETLIANNQAYAEMFDAQAHYYKEEEEAS